MFSFELVILIWLGDFLIRPEKPYEGKRGNFLGCLVTSYCPPSLLNK